MTAFAFTVNSAQKVSEGAHGGIGLSIPKTHDLATLLNALVPYHSTLRQFRRRLLFLTDFAVNARYPGTNATKRQAIAARKWMNRVRTAARELLKIREPRRRS